MRAVVVASLILGGLYVLHRRPPLVRWPVDGEAADGGPLVTSRFRTSHRPDHQGIDVRARWPVPVYACGSGRVVRADRENNSSAGLNVTIMGTGAQTGIQWKVFHLSRVDVNVSDSVEPDTVIGLSGNTNGAPEGGAFHVHFETLSLAGGHFDPLAVLPPLPEAVA
jgi:murein DD-endopeptidase MepM/ murein hydrolase activator NlpD